MRGGQVHSLPSINCFARDISAARGVCDARDGELGMFVLLSEAFVSSSHDDPAGGAAPFAKRSYTRDGGQRVSRFASRADLSMLSILGSDGVWSPQILCCTFLIIQPDA